MWNPWKGSHRIGTVCHYGAQNDYTHISIILEFISQLHKTSVTHGFLAGFFCIIWAPRKVFSVNVPSMHTNCLGIDFPNVRTHTQLLHKRIVSELFVHSFRAAFHATRKSVSQVLLDFSEGHDLGIGCQCQGQA